MERYELSFLSTCCEVWKYNYWCLHRRKWKHRAVLCEAGQESQGRLRWETPAPGAPLCPLGMAWHVMLGWLPWWGDGGGGNTKMTGTEHIWKCQKLLLFRISGITYLMHYFSSVWVPFSCCKGTTEEVCRCARTCRCCFKPNLPKHKGITPVLKICVHRVFHVQTVTNFNAEKPHPERKPFYSHHVKEYK